MTIDGAIVRSVPAALSAPREQLINRGFALARQFEGSANGQLVARNTRLHLQGHFVLPQLIEDGLHLRLGTGAIHNAVRISDHELVVITSAGASLFDVRSGETRWTFDCPCFSGTASASGRLVALCTSLGTVIRDSISGHQQIVGTRCSEGSSAKFASDERTLLVAYYEVADDSGAGNLSEDDYRQNGAGFRPSFLLDVFDLFERDYPFTIELAEWPSQPVNFTVFPDETMLAVVDGDIVQIIDYNNYWDVYCELTLMGRGDRVAISPDGAQIAIAMSDGTVFWNYRNGSTIKIGTMESGCMPAIAMRYSEDSQCLAVLYSDSTLSVIDVINSETRHDINTPSMVGISTVLRQQGRLHVTGWNRQEIINLQISETLMAMPVMVDSKTHCAAITHLSFLGFGEKLVSTSGDGTVRIWDTHDGALLQVFDIGKGNAIISTSLSSRGTELDLLMDTGQFARMSLVTGELIHQTTLKGFHSLSCHDVVISPDRSLIAAVVGDAVCLWSHDDGSKSAVYHPVASASGVGHSVWGMRFSPSGDMLALGMENQPSWGYFELVHVNPTPVRLIRVPVEGTSHSTHFSPVVMVAFSPDGRLLAVAGTQSIQVILLGEFGDATRSIGDWRRRASALGEPIIHPPFPVISDFENETSINCLVFSPSGRRIAVGDGGDARLVDIRENDVVASVRGHTSDITAIAFSPGESRLATGDADGVIRIWNIPPLSGQQRLEALG